MATYIAESVMMAFGLRMVLYFEAWFEYCTAHSTVGVLCTAYRMKD